MTQPYPNHSSTNGRLVRLAVQRQIRDITAQATDPNARRQLLQRARVVRDENQSVPVDLVPTGSGFHTAIARGEILIDSAAYADQAHRTFLDGFQLVPGPVRHARLAARIVRLHNPNLGPTAVDGIVSWLKDRKVQASRNYMVAQAPIGKGLGGPEPDSGAGPFDQYPVEKQEGAPIVAVIDTGITGEVRTDGWLAGIRNQSNVDPLDVLPPDGMLDRMAGHGTFVSGIIQQVAPGATIRMYRALDTDGLATEADLAAAMVAAVTDGAGILSLSFGCQTVNDEEPLALRAALDTIGDAALVIAAAGNYGDERKVWPAAFADVTAVAALDAHMQPTAWSSRGDWVDCSTIGEGLLSTYVPGIEEPDSNPTPDVFPANAWGRWTGSSFAAPQIAAYVLRQSQPHNPPDPKATLATILDGGTAIPGFGKAVEILPGM